jgi:hypothetical protein
MPVFKLPLLNVLDSLKEDKVSYLDKVILRLFKEGELSIEEISILLGVSSTVIRDRIPPAEMQEMKTNNNSKDQSQINEILERKNKGECVKEIAYEMNISQSKVYKALKDLSLKTGNFT